ncbi:MAG: PQQ-binding-like beta-propeller repeat protein [Thermoplasmata archaeon]|nr:MAG: PQQ-binding-like beta-propeller repeat protein [Thermoplasmata archaeon]
MEKDEIKFLSGILIIVVIATIIITFVAIPIITKNVSAQSDYLEFQGVSYTGSAVRSVDISDGNSNPSNVYVVVGSAQNLSVFDASGNLQWYNNSLSIADFSSYGTSHGVAISGDAQYVVAGTTSDEVYAFDISGNFLWYNDMYRSRGDCYSVDVSNSSARFYSQGNYDAFVVSCSGDCIYVINASTGSNIWSEQISEGNVMNVRISEDGNWIVASSDNNRIEFYNNTDPSNHEMVWFNITTDSYVNVDIARNGLIVVAGEDDPNPGAGTSNVYEFDVGADGTWGTGDDQTPGWTRAEAGDIYAVAVSDCNTVAPAGPTFSVISGEGPNDDESDESYYTSPNKIRNWSTGLICSADATYDNNSAYNFRLFGSFTPENSIILVAQNSDNIIDSYTANGTVTSVAISYSYCQPTQFYDYFVAGDSAGYVYFFTYAYP